LSSSPAIARASLTNWSTPTQLLKVILVLALPVTATNILQTLVGFVDTRMVSPLNQEALAAISVGRTSMWMMMSIFMGLAVGMTAYISRTTGAGRHDRAKAYATIGLVTGVIIGLVLMVVGLLIGDLPVKWMVTSEAGSAITAAQALTRQYAWDYMSILLIGLAGVGLQFASVSVFNSLGRTVFPMWLLVLTNVANFFGNWLLIPPFKVAGCAWSTTITTGVVAIVAVFLLAKQNALSLVGETLVRPLRKSWEMMKLGLPVTVQMSLRALSSLAIIKVITFLPEVPPAMGQGALHVGLQAESLAFMPAFAFSTAVATLVGQNLGANKVGQARQSTWFCVLGGQMIMWTMALAFWFFPDWFITLFIGRNAPAIVAPAAEYLKVIAACLPGLGVGVVMMGVLRGSGDTQITAGITLAAMWLFRIPLVILMAFDHIGGTSLGFGLGLTGIWWAMTISVYFEAGLAFWRFSAGHWSRVKLSEA